MVTEQIGLTPEEVVGKILASPDIAASLQNPKVVEAIMDVRPLLNDNYSF